MISKPTRDIDLAYFKGIFATEGNTRSTDGIRIGNTSKELLSWLVDTFGGSLCYQQPSPLTRRDYFFWSVNAGPARILISLLPDVNSLMRALTHAYIAGLIDGDGMIGMHNSHRKSKGNRLESSPRVIFSNSTDNTTPEYIHSRYGGSLTLQQPRGGIHEKKPYWYLSLSGKEAYTLIKDIQPYLIIKKEKAAEVLSSCVGKDYYERPDTQTERADGKGTPSTNSKCCVVV